MTKKNLPAFRGIVALVFVADLLHLYIRSSFIQLYFSLLRKLASLFHLSRVCDKGEQINDSTQHYAPRTDATAAFTSGSSPFISDIIDRLSRGF